MAMDYAALKAELDSGHPTTGAYSLTDNIARDQLNEVNRPAQNTAEAMFLYCLTRKHRTNQGADTTFTPIIGRLSHIARSEAGADPFGRGLSNELALQHVHACQTFVSLFESAISLGIDFSDSNLPFGFAQAAGAYSTSHQTDLQELSNNQRSRAQELGFGRIRTQDVAHARTL